MANKKHKPHTAKKAPPKTNNKGLAGAEKLKAVKRGIAQEAAKPVGAVAGLILSGVGSNLLDKIDAIKPDATVTGFQVKKLIKPLILLGTGGATIFMTHGKKGAIVEFINGTGWGLTGGAVIVGAKSVMDVSLVQGLAGASTTSHKAEADYYKKQAAEMATLLEQSKFNPPLPEGKKDLELEGAPYGPSEIDYAGLEEVL